VYYVLRGAIVITNIHVHAMIGVGVEPERKVTYSIRDVYSSSRQCELGSCNKPTFSPSLRNKGLELSY
jgi:hypothetical protein